MSHLQDIPTTDSVLRSIMDASPVGIVVFDHDACVIYANDLAKQLFGKSGDALIGNRCGDFIACHHRLSDPRGCGNSEDCPTCPFYKAIQAVLEGNTDPDIAYGEALVQRESDLPPIWLKFKASGIVLDGHKAVVMAMDDITERMREEQKQIERERYLKTILETTADGFWIIDPGGNFVEVNEAYCRMSGYARDELLTLGIDHIDAIETPDQTIERIQRIIANGYEVFETRHRRKDGTIFDVEMSVTYLNSRGGQFICFARDINDRKRAEDALQESERELRASQQIAHIGSWRLDVATNQVRWTEELYNMYGFDTALPPPPYTEHMKLFTPESWERLSTSLANTRETGIACELELETVRKDGSNGWMWVRGEAVRDSDGNIVGLWGAAQDITDRKRALEALRQSEEKFRLTFAASPDSVNLNRLEDGLYIDINQGFTRLTGFTREDVIGKTTLEINIWHDPDERQKLVRGLRARGFYENLEAQFRRKDGTLVNTLMSARVIQINNEPYIISITRDITEFKRVQNALRESERHLQKVFDILPVGLWFADKDGTLLKGNPAGIKIWGAQPLVDPSLYGIFKARRFPSGEEIAPTDWSLYHTIKDKATIVDELLEIETFDGKKKIILNSTSPVLDEQGDVQGAIVVNQDVTERKQMEDRLQRAQKMEAIGALAGGIAHDFNNILFPITGMSEMLLDDFKTDSVQHENLMMIYNAALRAKDLVNQILSFSRQAEQQKVAMRLQPIIKEVIKLSRATIPSNIAIQQNIQPDCGAVLADPTNLHQVAMNLVTNAFHAVEQDGGSITVELRQLQLSKDDAAQSDLKPGAYVLLSVADSGHGILPDAMPKIFDPYFTTKPKGKGTGLGLSVCYGIVKDLGGEIKVYSEIGKGTVFNIYLPLLQHDDASGTAPAVAALPTGSEHILVVDDELSIVKLEKQMLERLGYRVTIRTSSPDALEAFRANPEAYDLVLTDMTMPNMTGENMAKKMMAIRADIPVIICTGFSEKMSENVARQAGVKGFLMKPLTRADLAKMVRRVLDEATKGKLK